MTPVIDVVFLLIIFFMLVCQFIATEQFQVQVPDEISSAQQNESERKTPITITVMAGDDGNAEYALDSEKLGKMHGTDLAQLICSEIDHRLPANSNSEKTVCLRCDKSITFGQIKYLLSGISQSNADKLDWKVLKE